MKDFIKRVAPLASVATYLVIAMGMVAYRHYWMIPICAIGALCALYVNFNSK